MNNLELLKAGVDDSLDILEADAMDLIMGGDVTCKKDFTQKGGVISCGCGYSNGTIKVVEDIIEF